MSNYTQNMVDFTVENYTPTKIGDRISTATYAALLAGRA